MGPAQCTGYQRPALYCKSATTLHLLQVDLSIINGETVIRDGKLLTADLAHIIAEHNRCSEAICAHYTQAAIGA